MMTTHLQHHGGVRDSRSRQTLPRLVARLAHSPERPRIATGGDQQLLAAHWWQQRPHAHGIDDPERMTLVFFRRSSRIVLETPVGEYSCGESLERVAIAPPGERMAWRCFGPMEYLQVCFPIAADGAGRVQICDDPLLQRLGSALVDTLRARQRLEPEEAIAWRTLLCNNVRRRSDSAAATTASDIAYPSITSIDAAIMYLDGHLNVPLTVPEIGRLLNLSRTKVSELFRSSTGMSPHQFLMRRRTMKAKQLLESSSLSLCDVAQRVGFSSQSHMTSMFRRFTGQTPHRYRQYWRGAATKPRPSTLADSSESV